MSKIRVSELLSALSLSSFHHVSIRRKDSAGEDYVGGGSPVSVSRRFGNLEIKGSDIRENVLIIYVANEN